MYFKCTYYLPMFYKKILYKIWIFFLIHGAVKKEEKIRWHNPVIGDISESFDIKSNDTSDESKNYEDAILYI